MDQMLEKKLRELIDRQEIWSILLRYARGIDRLDRDLIRSCYHDDAVDDHHTFVAKPDEFIDWAFDYSLRYQTVPRFAGLRQAHSGRGFSLSG